MEAHPIPQNVTSFQFRLIGDMTLKQFGYLASGVGVAYLMFVFLATKLPLLAWPIIIVSAGLGFAFAFLPIGSRPLDYWLTAFLKAVYSPTKLTWQKNGKIYSQNPIFKARFSTFMAKFTTPEPLSSSTAAFPTSLKPTTGLFNKITATTSPTQSTIETSQPTIIQAGPKTDLPSKENLAKTVDLAIKAQHLQSQIVDQERQLNQIKSATMASPAGAPVNNQQIGVVMANLQNLITQASAIQKEIDTVQGTPSSPASTPSPIERQKVKVTVVAPSAHKQTQLTLTSFPNVINGLVTDSDNNTLEAVIVVIYNKEGLPMRALKTNKLGQFTGSTPLPNGTYTIEMEKEGYTFDVLQIELTGEVMLPIKIAAKKTAVS